MNCEEARQHWSLYHDSEGDPELFLRINAHLEDCPACAEWFQNESRLEELLVDRLSARAATRDLWDRVMTAAGVKHLPRTSTLRRWVFIASTVAVAACVLIVITISLSHRDEHSLSRLSADVHEHLANGQTEVEFSSNSDVAVEGYLRQRVSFPVRCPPRSDSGFVVSGAGTTRLSDENAAYVFGTVNGRPVSVLILSRDSLARFPEQRETLQREQVHHWREGRVQAVMAAIDRNIVLVVGDSDAEQLENILSFYGTYPHNDHG